MNAETMLVREVFRLLASAPALRILLALDAGPATVAETVERTRMGTVAARSRSRISGCG